MKLQNAKLQILQLLRTGEVACRRLFLDYHGLKLIHGWMSDISETDRMESLKYRLELLKTLDSLTINNKANLVDSKVYSTVKRWTAISEYTTTIATTSIYSNFSTYY